MQLANAAAHAYRTMGLGIGVTLVAIRTFEDTASAQAEGLAMVCVQDSGVHLADYCRHWQGLSCSLRRLRRSWCVVISCRTGCCGRVDR